MSVKVRYIGKGHPGVLTPGKIYEVVDQDESCYSIVDDDEDGDYAYPKTSFELVEE
mgnify:CR=1 FL=1